VPQGQADRGGHCCCGDGLRAGGGVEMHPCAAARLSGVDRVVRKRVRSSYERACEPESPSSIHARLVCIIRLSGEPDYTKWRASVSIRYEHEPSREGRRAVIRSPDPVPSFHPCHQSGEDQNPGATHRFGECCASGRPEYEFEQHRCSANQHLAEPEKMKERVSTGVTVLGVDGQIR